MADSKVDNDVMMQTNNLQISLSDEHFNGCLKVEKETRLVVCLAGQPSRHLISSFVDSIHLLVLSEPLGMQCLR